MKRTKGKKRRLIAAVLVPLLILFWAWNNYTLCVNRQTIASGKITAPFRAAVVSDLHESVLMPAVVRRVARCEPDLIFVPGDLYTDDGRGQVDKAVAFCAQLAAIAPTYFVCGDHDHEQSYYDALREVGVHVLDSVCETVTVNGNAIGLYGICKVWFPPKYSLSSTFPPPDVSRFNILLSHLPAMERFADFPLDLVVSGDSHGGVARLPFLGGLIYDDVLLPKLFYHGAIYDKGLFEVGGCRLFVTAGIGSYPFPLRLFNRPEVVLLQFEGEDNHEL